MPPQVNAALLSISTDGQSEDWNQSAGPAGPVKWQGNAGAYVIENIRTRYATTGGPMTKVKDVQIIIDQSLIDVNGNPLQVATGDIFTYTFQGVQYARRAMETKNPYLPGLAIQEYIVVHLNPEAVETALESE